MLNEISSQVLRTSLPATMTDEAGRFYRPPEIDAATLKRLYFIRPMMEPCVRTTLLNLGILERAIKGEPFYRGRTTEHPQDLWSDLLDIDLNHESRVIEDLSEALKLYRSGDSPFHFDCFRQMQFTTQTLLKYFIDIFGKASPFHHALQLFELASQMLVINMAKGISDEEWQSDIERFANALKNSFVQICKFLKSFEFNAATPKPMTVADAVSLNAQASAAIVKETSATVKEIVSTAAGSAADKIVSSTERAADKVVHAVEKGAAKVARATRKQKGRKPKAKIDVQEAVWNIHERVKKLQDVKDMHPKGKATRENEFLYAKSDLKGIGVTTLQCYCETLDARIKRKSRKQPTSSSSA